MAYAAQGIQDDYTRLDIAPEVIAETRRSADRIVKALEDHSRLASLTSRLPHECPGRRRYAKGSGVVLPQDCSRRTASFARNFAMRSINFTGTGSESGKRIVPLLTLYDASWSLNAATMRSPAGYNE
jgi:hypothetical protein